MEITEVKIFLKESVDKKLKAYATITIDDCFVVRNVKVIEGNKGLFVAMPSRKLREACPKCNFRNPVRSKFCNFCGSSLPTTDPRQKTEEERLSEHRDIAHPITSDCREYIQNKVLGAYEAERQKTQTGEPAQQKPNVVEKEREHEESIADEGDLEL
jgi:stage V sporulation protein G